MTRPAFLRAIDAKLGGLPDVLLAIGIGAGLAAVLVAWWSS